MEYTMLGQTDLYVSRLCFGTWAFGGDWGAVDVAQNRAAIRKALDLGINFFDTAQAYGWGVSERVLSVALRSEIEHHRHGIVLATKGGLRHDGKHLLRDSSPAWLRQGLEASLRNLATDYVDLYQVHWPDPQTPFEETARALDAFVREGKVRYVGVSNYDVPEMETFQRGRKLDALQPPYHLFRRDIEQGILPYCVQHGIGVLVYGPMAHGLLTGRMTPETHFAPDDWRAHSDLFQGDTFRRELAIVDDLERFAAERGCTVGQLAIAWTLANPAVDVAIVGARTPSQIEQNAPAAEIHLTPEGLEQIRRIMRGAVAVGGPTPEAA
jgi:aryl-alcohol dehydrogenase-like predicted oxidoreductase